MPNKQKNHYFKIVPDPWTTLRQLGFLVPSYEPTSAPPKLAFLQHVRSARSRRC